MRIVIKFDDDTEMKIKKIALLKGIDEREIVEALRQKAEKYITNEVERELKEALA